MNINDFTIDTLLVWHAKSQLTLEEAAELKASMSPQDIAQGLEEERVFTQWLKSVPSAEQILAQGVAEQRLEKLLQQPVFEQSPSHWAEQLNEQSDQHAVNDAHWLSRYRYAIAASVFVVVTMVAVMQQQHSHESPAEGVFSPAGAEMSSNRIVLSTDKQLIYIQPRVPINSEAFLASLSDHRYNILPLSDMEGHYSIEFIDKLSREEFEKLLVQLRNNKEVYDFVGHAYSDKR